MKYIPNTKLITGALLMCATLSAQAQKDSVQVAPDITYTADHPSYIIGGIQVEGADEFDREMLLNSSELNVGQTIEVPGPEISDAIRRYWKQGLYSDVKIEADSIVGNKVYLKIKLTSRPRISQIRYNGVKKSEREDIEAQLGIKKGSQITPDMLDRAKIIIKRYYEGKGFKNAEIEILQTDDVAGENQVIVDINIDKKEKIKVHRIYITGVDEKQANAIKLAAKKTFEKKFNIRTLFKSKKFLVDKYEEDKGYMLDKLNEWGYRDALLKKDSVVNVDDKHVDIYLDFYRGDKYYIRNISWVGNTVYSTESLNRALGMKKGDLYNQTLMRKRLTEDENSIGNQYYNNGYVFYRLDPVEMEVDGDSIDLEMRISEGTQATLNRVIIKGNDRVYENVIRRELHTKPGDLFTRDAIMRSFREISSMGHFNEEKAVPDVQPDVESGTVDVTYNLEPKASDQVELSFGWGQTGVVGHVGLRFNNFSMQNLFGKGRKRAGFIPQGDGQTLSISGQTNGTYYQAYSLSFLDPWFGGKKPNQFSAAISYSKQTGVNSDYYSKNYYNSYYNYLYGLGSSSIYDNGYNFYDPDQFVKMFSVSLGFGKRLSWPDDLFSFMVEANYTRYMLKNWNYFLISDGNCNNFNISFTLSRNSTDQQFYPHYGSEFLFSVSATPPYSLWDGRDYKNLANNYNSATYQREAQEKYRWIEYNKWRFKFRNFTALGSKYKCPVLMTRFEFGILGSYNRYKKSPFETYYVGGDGMSGYTTGYATETIGLRGYDNGSIANNGYSYSRMTLELRYPLMLETSTSIYALAFLEGGNAWYSIRDFNPLDMKRSAGFGVRIQLPMVGLLGVDWAYGFQKYSGTQKIGGSQFHFIIGQEF